MERKKHTHLSLEERRQIYFLLGRKMSAVEIARQLNRHHSTIYREIQRNSYWDEDDHKNNDYYAPASNVKASPQCARFPHCVCPHSDSMFG